MAARCRACGAPILWVRTSAGNMMPCEPELRLYWTQPGGQARVVTWLGDVVACRLEGEPEAAAGVGWIPHWAKCPGADRMRGAAPARREPVDGDPLERIRGLRDALDQREAQRRTEAQRALRASMERAMRTEGN